MILHGTLRRKKATRGSKLYIQIAEYPTTQAPVYFHPFRHISTSSPRSNIQNITPTRLTKRREFDVVIGMLSGSFVDISVCVGPRGDDPDCEAGIFIAEEMRRDVR